MKFKELLEVLHPYTDINIFIEDSNSLTLFETSKPGLLEGNHQSYYDKHKDWDVVHAYPDHNATDGNYMGVRIEAPISHEHFYQVYEEGDSHLYCECGDSIPNTLGEY
ncbi:hypothetical protein [Lactococcus phage P087]|uniref:Uncharacterized protein n=1 Tax=Lactococcus phage P087 TaxID=641487 RepID=C3U2K1_9CAUD|nr:hypothetical protein P087_gp11 [Lactococcus phage P087]ACP41687.1 hypothetical protein [Lactococcus phage P087]